MPGKVLCSSVTLGCRMGTSDNTVTFACRLRSGPISLRDDYRLHVNLQHGPVRSTAGCCITHMAPGNLCKTNNGCRSKFVGAHVHRLNACAITVSAIPPIVAPIGPGG